MWQVQQHEGDEDAVLQPDGTYLYKGPKGRLETWNQREARLAHNQKMVFHRSFSHLLDRVNSCMFKVNIYGLLAPPGRCYPCTSYT